MDIGIFSWFFRQFESFIIILTRVSFIIFMMPFLGSRSLPIVPKIGFSLMTSLILLPTIKINSSPLSLGPLSFMVFIVGEAIIGFLIGFSMKLIFTGVQFAGEFIGIQMGFSIANVLDPQSEIDTNVMVQLYYFFAILVFFAVDGHHWFFKAIAHSFQILSPGGIFLGEGLLRHILILSGRIFQIAIRIISPIMAILIFIQLALGVVARMIPQINLLISSFPLTIGIGLIFLGLSLDLLFPFLRGIIEESGRGLVHVLLPLMKR